jgi:hypothetical protein
MISQPPDPGDYVRALLASFGGEDRSEQLKAQIHEVEMAIRTLLLAHALTQQQLRRVEEERDDAVRRHDELSRSLPQRAPSGKELLGRRLSPEVEALRALWPKTRTSQASRQSRVALAVLHGLAEWSAQRYPLPALTQFFDKHRGAIENGAGDAIAVEKDALDVGLRVCRPGRCPEAIEAAHFGYVEEADDEKARVALLDDRDENIVCLITVPCRLLPPAYRTDGAGIAWVARRYPHSSEVEGRFEPASAAP